jgi:hypothetical protein
LLLDLLALLVLFGAQVLQFLLMLLLELRVHVIRIARARHGRPVIVDLRIARVWRRIARFVGRARLRRIVRRARPIRIGL